jgi:hypothetical protein
MWNRFFGNWPIALQVAAISYAQAQPSKSLVPTATEHRL